MWMAWLSRRFPRRDNLKILRRRSRGHLDRRGAVVGGEVVAVGESTDVGDVTDDRCSDDCSDPEQLGERRLGRLDGGGDALLGLAQLPVETAQVGDKLHGDGLSGCGNRTRRLELVEQTGGLSCADLAGEPARCQLAQHRMKSAGDAGAVTGQVTVTLGPHLHHLDVILRPHLRHRRAQRRNGHRTGVVGIVLVRRSSSQQPDPGGQLRLHVEDPLTGGDELLGQQIADRTRSSPTGCSSGSRATAVCDPLCGSIPIITAITTAPFARSGS
jgi:hypothetical protein